jgi:NADPH:quinone reductase-like Zn-dependent oxidoreductase
MTDLPEKIRNLPPEKLDSLLKQLKPRIAGPAQAHVTRAFRPQEDQNFSLVAERPGILESLAFRTRSRFSTDSSNPEFRLGPDDVEIEIYAASLNFRDVAVALGMYPVPPGYPPPQLGCDGAGVVTAIGEHVSRFRPGDEVVCLSGKSAFSRYTCATQGQVFPRPPHLSFEQAATIPLAFVTAYYGLTRVGRLYPGDRILIHSAAGGVGLAAIHIAQMTGAEIYATAGTPEKRDYLRSLGIKYIMDSRSLQFVDEIRRVTNGEGVDVILNSLSGDALTQSFRLLRPDGRFVELGKRDFVPGRVMEMQPFGNGLSFSVIDIRQSNKAIASVIEELSHLFRAGTLQPTVTEIVPVSKLVDTFRRMSLGKHIGKFAVSMRSDPIMVRT